MLVKAKKGKGMQGEALALSRSAAHKQQLPEEGFVMS